MAISMNIFRESADVSHTISKCILIWAIHSNKSAEGISLLTQLLYVLVFLTRYVDLFWVPPSFSYWNFVLKNFYIWSSLYILLLQLRIFPRTREKEKGWQLAIYAVVGSVVAAPAITPIFHPFNIMNILETFSLILESVCILPQLLLLRQTTVPTVITSFYLLTLGSYRFLYILNWIYRAADHDGDAINPISVIFGVVQTALYLDFAWVYWTRQRVKLRGGGIIDSDDLRKSWFVGRALRSGTTQGGHGGPTDDDDDAAAADDVEQQRQRQSRRGNGASKGTGPNRWGKRGVSISADATLQSHDRSRHQQQQQQSQANKGHHISPERGTALERTSMLNQPVAFEDADEDEDEDDPLFSEVDVEVDADADKKETGAGAQQRVLNSGQAWSGGGGGGGGGGQGGSVAGL